MKNDMKETDYYKSGRHTENARNAVRKASIQASKNAEIKRINAIILYDKNPTLCFKCHNPLDYARRNEKFCNRTCSARFNNSLRQQKSSTKIIKIPCMDCSIDVEISAHSPKHIRCNSCKKLKINTKPKVISTTTKRKIKRTRIPRIRKQHLITCKICKNTVLLNNKNAKTCGARKCKTVASVGQRTYQNGSRKPVWYYNKHQGKDVLLDSSWEVRIADLLTEKDMVWVRPNPVDWIDSTGKSRCYFPDFYLPYYALYLDPKNLYCMSQDVEKLAAICKKIDLKYGAIEYIIEVIENL